MDFDPWLAELLKEYEFDPTIKVERHLGAMSNVEMDPNRMRQVVMNLLDNACQAMMGEDDGTEPARDLSLEVSALRDHDQVVLRITDNGPGVSLENQGKIFEPLFSTKSFGVGLGLPIIKRIIEQHGGAIEVVSEPAESTSFIVRLPLKIPFGSIT
jgi:signal transduction histidine kinase